MVNVIIFVYLLIPPKNSLGSSRLFQVSQYLPAPGGRPWESAALLQAVHSPKDSLEGRLRFSFLPGNVLKLAIKRGRIWVSFLFLYRSEIQF